MIPLHPFRSIYNFQQRIIKTNSNVNQRINDVKIDNYFTKYQFVLLLLMTEIFIEGYSEYELEALKIPVNARGRCLHQLVDYTKCFQKETAFNNIFKSPCEDELAKFSRCNQRIVNYTSFGNLVAMKSNNPSAFKQLNVSPTLESVYSPTFINFHR